MDEHVSVQLGFVGDFCLSGVFCEKPEKIQHAFELCNQLNSEVDFSVANFEFSLYENTEKDPGSMQCPAYLLDGIENAGFDMFCLANNHIGDYGHGNLLYTKKFLESKNILTVGVEEDALALANPKLTEVMGRTIAFVNATDATHYRARKSSPGVFPLEERLLKQVILRALKFVGADMVVVCIHADLEFTNYPSPWRVNLARRLVDYGASLVVCHSSHALQGVEYYNNGLIAYSLGNFIFPVHSNSYMVDRNGGVDEGAYLKVQITFSEGGVEKISHSFTPVVIESEDVPSIENEKRSKHILEKVELYNVRIKESEYLRKEHYSLCRSNMIDTLMGLYYTLLGKGFRAAVSYVAIHFSKMHTRWICGFFTLGRH